MSETMPEFPDYCWPVNHLACDTWDSYDPLVQDMADAAAGQALRALTAYRIGGCPVLVRPCVIRGPLPHYTVAPVASQGQFQPYVYNGLWYNAVCGVASCGCGVGSVMHLRAPVGRVDQVKVDGVVLDPSAYIVEWDRIIRVDGGAWPASQDRTLPDTEPGTMSVTYLNAIPVDGLGAYAAGVLACEIAAAASGRECRLPAGVTNMVRQGVTYEITESAFPGGFTGIPEVDQFIRYWNPHNLTVAPTVTSPDTMGRF